MSEEERRNGNVSGKKPQQSNYTYLSMSAMILPKNVNNLKIMNITYPPNSTFLPPESVVSSYI